MPQLDPDAQKKIIKEAIQEWLDTKYTEFGKWTLHGILAAAVAYSAYYLLSHGWIPK